MELFEKLVHLGVQLGMVRSMFNLQKEFSFDRCLVNTCYVPGFIPGMRDIGVCKPSRDPCPCHTHILMGGARQ